MNKKIFIPAKGCSVRCPNKNKKLLPFVINALSDNKKEMCVVISDSNEILALAQKLGVEAFKSNAQDGEFFAIQDYINNCGYLEDDFVMLPLTQPLREIGLVKRIINNEIGDCDFICSSNKLVDRSVFAINNDEFVQKSKERKGVMCKEYKMIDGAIYRIKTKFLKKVVESKNANSTFWAGNFKTINNSMPFIDIDTVEDINSFFNLIELFNYGNKKV